MSVAKARNCTEKCKLGGRDTAHTSWTDTSKFGDMFILVWGHRTSKFGHMFILGWGHCTQFQTLAVGRVGWLLGGWVGGLPGSSKNNATSWLHLRIQDGAECGNKINS